MHHHSKRREFLTILGSDISCDRGTADAFPNQAIRLITPHQ
jgi:hypothetical protein